MKQVGQENNKSFDAAVKMLRGIPPKERARIYKMLQEQQDQSLNEIDFKNLREFIKKITSKS